MKYFFDNSVSYKFAKVLRALDVDAVALREEYPQGIKDIPLFQALRGRDLVYVTTDKAQLTREHEARALKQAGVTSLFFGRFFQRMRFWDQAVWIVRRWPRIDGFASGVAPGTCAEIKQNGTALVYPF